MVFGHGFDSRLVHYLRKSSVCMVSEENFENTGFFCFFTFCCEKHQFIDQYATATCSRECIRKWHKMQPGKKLGQVQQDYLVDVIMTWIQKELERQKQKT